MIKETKIAVLVVTYNRKQFLEENIKAITGQSYASFDFLICDNASDDGTGALVKKYMQADQRIIYFNTGENLGGAGGFNFGLKYVYKKQYEYCWIMDDDAIPEKNALEKMVSKAAELQQESFSYLASVVLWTDGTPCYMNQMEIDSAKLYFHRNEAKIGLLPVESCSFVGCFVNLFYGRQAGLPIKEFFLYGDDTEFTLRLGKLSQGFMNVESVIIHKMATNVKLGVSEAPEDRIQRYVYDYRNQVYISRVCKEEKKRVVWLKFMKECAKVLLRSKNKKCRRILVIMKGYIEGKRFHPQIEWE